MDETPMPDPTNAETPAAQPKPVAEVPHSAKPLVLPRVTMIPTTRGRGYSEQWDGDLLKNYHFNGSSSMGEWADWAMKAPEELQRFTVFQPLIPSNSQGEAGKYWVLGRGQYHYDAPSGTHATFEGVVLTKADLDAIDWAPHRLLKFLPETPPLDVQRPLGNIVIDPAELVPIVSPAKEGTDPVPSRAVVSAGRYKIAESAIPAHLNPQEYLIAHQADLKTPDARPRSWSTSANIVFPRSSELARHLRDTDWIYHPARDVALNPDQFPRHDMITQNKTITRQPAPPVPAPVPTPPTPPAMTVATADADALDARAMALIEQGYNPQVAFDHVLHGTALPSAPNNPPPPPEMTSATADALEARAMALIDQGYDSKAAFDHILHGTALPAMPGHPAPASTNPQSMQQQQAQPQSENQSLLQQRQTQSQRQIGAGAETPIASEPRPPAPEVQTSPAIEDRTFKQQRSSLFRTVLRSSTTLSEFLPLSAFDGAQKVHAPETWGRKFTAGQVADIWDSSAQKLEAETGLKGIAGHYRMPEGMSTESLKAFVDGEQKYFIIDGNVQGVDLSAAPRLTAFDRLGHDRLPLAVDMIHRFAASNPELKNIRFNGFDRGQVSNVLMGILYDFNPNDIQYYVHQDRIPTYRDTEWQRLNTAVQAVADPTYVTSPATMVDIIERHPVARAKADELGIDLDVIKARLAADPMVIAPGAGQLTHREIPSVPVMRMVAPEKPLDLDDLGPERGGRILMGTEQRYSVVPPSISYEPAPDLTAPEAAQSPHPASPGMLEITPERFPNLTPEQVAHLREIGPLPTHVYRANPDIVQFPITTRPSTWSGFIGGSIDAAKLPPVGADGTRMLMYVGDAATAGNYANALDTYFEDEPGTRVPADALPVEEYHRRSGTSDSLEEFTLGNKQLYRMETADIISRMTPETVIIRDSMQRGVSWGVVGPLAEPVPAVRIQQVGWDDDGRIFRDTSTGRVITGDLSDTPKLLAHAPDLTTVEFDSSAKKDRVYRLRNPQTGETLYAKRVTTAELDMTRRADAFKLPADSPLIVPEIAGDFGDLSPKLQGQLTQMAQVHPIAGEDRWLITTEVPFDRSVDLLHSDALYASIEGRPRDFAVHIPADTYDRLVDTVRQMNAAGITNTDIINNLRVVSDGDGQVKFSLIDFDPAAKQGGDVEALLKWREKLADVGVLVETGGQQQQSQRQQQALAESDPVAARRAEQIAAQQALRAQGGAEYAPVEPYHQTAFAEAQRAKEVVAKVSETPSAPSTVEEKRAAQIAAQRAQLQANLGKEAQSIIPAGELESMFQPERVNGAKTGQYRLQTPAGQVPDLDAVEKSLKAHGVAYRGVYDGEWRGRKLVGFSIDAAGFEQLVESGERAATTRDANMRTGDAIEQPVPGQQQAQYRQQGMFDESTALPSAQGNEIFRQAGVEPNPDRSPPPGRNPDVFGRHYGVDERTGIANVPPSEASREKSRAIDTAHVERVRAANEAAARPGLLDMPAPKAWIRPVIQTPGPVMDLGIGNESGRYRIGTASLFDRGPISGAVTPGSLRSGGNSDYELPRNLSYSSVAGEGELARGTGGKGGLIGGLIIGSSIRIGSSLMNGERDQFSIAGQGALGALDALSPGLGSGYAGITDSNLNPLDRWLNAADAATGTFTTGATVAIPLSEGASAPFAVGGLIANTAVNGIHDITYSLGMSEQGGLVHGAGGIIGQTYTLIANAQELSAKKADIPDSVVTAFIAGTKDIKGPTKDPVLDAYLHVRDTALMEGRDGRVQSETSVARFGYLPRSPVSAEEVQSRIDDAARNYIAQGGSLETVQFALSTRPNLERTQALEQDFIRLVPTAKTKGQLFDPVDPALRKAQRLKTGYEQHPDDPMWYTTLVATAHQYMKDHTLQDVQFAYYHVAPFVLSSDEISKMEQTRELMRAFDGLSSRIVHGKEQYTPRDGKLEPVEIARGLVKLGIYNSAIDTNHDGELDRNEALNAIRHPEEFKGKGR
jgi:hypothetical protein